VATLKKGFTDIGIGSNKLWILWLLCDNIPADTGPGSEEPGPVISRMENQLKNVNKSQDKLTHTGAEIH